MTFPVELAERSFPVTHQLIPMSTDKCDGCGADVPIAGGIANLWSSNPQFEDGSEHFLCYGCIGQLPDHPEAADVAALEPND
jgi:hypothetical protein